MEYKTRAEWGARPPKATVRWNPKNLLGVGVHWFGNPNGATDHTKCDDLMRSVQNTHMAPGGLGTVNGGSDIAYNHVICLHGVVFEGRGWNVQTGANGTTDSNRNYAAACVMLGTGNATTAFSPKVQAALRELIQAWFSRGTGRSVKKHGYWTGSSCPGPTIGAWVDAKKYLETAEAPVSSSFFDWIDDFIFWQLVGNRLNPPAPRPANIPLDVPQAAWDLAAVAQKCIIYNGAAESFMDWSEDRFINGIIGPPAGMTSTPSLWWPDAERLHKMLNDYKAL